MQMPCSGHGRCIEVDTCDCESDFHGSVCSKFMTVFKVIPTRLKSRNTTAIEIFNEAEEAFNVAKYAISFGLFQHIYNYLNQSNISIYHEDFSTCEFMMANCISKGEGNYMKSNELLFIALQRQKYWVRWNEKEESKDFLISEIYGLICENLISSGNVSAVRNLAKFFTNVKKLYGDKHPKFASVMNLHGKYHYDVEKDIHSSNVSINHSMEILSNFLNGSCNETFVWDLLSDNHNHLGRLYWDIMDTDNAFKHFRISYDIIFENCGDDMSIVLIRKCSSFDL